MATQASSTFAFAGVGSSNAPTIVEVIPTTQKPELWCHFNKVKLSDNSIKAHCKHCGHFLQPNSNSTLQFHVDKYCERLKLIFGTREGYFCIQGGPGLRTIGGVCDSRRFVVQPLRQQTVNQAASKLSSTSI